MPNIDSDSDASFHTARSGRSNLKLNQFLATPSSSKSRKNSSSSKRTERLRRRESRLEAEMLERMSNLNLSFEAESESCNSQRKRKNSLSGGEVDSNSESEKFATSPNPNILLEPSDNFNADNYRQDVGYSQEQNAGDEIDSRIEFMSQGERSSLSGINVPEGNYNVPEKKYNVPVKVTEAIQRFQIPVKLANEGYELMSPGKSNGIPWYFGVVLKKPGESDTIWFCCAEAVCRDNPKFYALKSGYSSSASRHLKGDHGIKTAKALLESKRKSEKDKYIEGLKETYLYKSNPARMMELAWANMMVSSQLPFSFITNEETRVAIELTCLPEMNRKLSVPRLKHRVVEIYCSVKENVIQEIRKSLDFFQYNILSLNIDLWKPSTGGISGSKKYVGVRVYFTNYKWELVSHFLAIRKFNPSFEDRSGEESMTKVGQGLIFNQF